MPTINVDLRTDKRANDHGEYSLMIRLYYQKIMYPYTFDFKVHPKFWNKDSQQIKRCKFYDDYGKMNHIINQKKQRAEMLMEKWIDENVEPYVLREIISLDLKEDKRDASVDIISFCDDLIAEYEEEGKVSSSKNYANLKSKLREYSDSDFLGYDEVDPYFVEDFFHWLKHIRINRRTGEKGLAHNTAYKSVEYLKSAYRKAQKRFRSLQKDDPFFYFDESPKQTTTKYLSEDEFDQFKQITPSGKNSQLAKDMFIFAVYACGMRFSDVFRLSWEQIDFERESVQFVAMKTKNKKTGEFINPIGEEGMNILNKYHKKNGDKKFIFDWANDTNIPIETSDGIYRLKQSCSVITSRAFIDDLSKKLGKHINFHMSRATFANLIRKSGLTVSEISEIFDHADVSITKKYLDRMVNTDNTKKREFLQKNVSGW